MTMPFKKFLLNFPYDTYVDRLAGGPDIAKHLAIRAPQYSNDYNNWAVEQGLSHYERYEYTPVEQFRHDKITQDFIDEYGEESFQNLEICNNKNFTGIDQGVRFLNECADDADEDNRPMCWWYPEHTPVNTMPSDKDWDDINYVDFKLAPGAFKNRYILEALNKFFNNKQPVKVFHVCNQVSNDFMNWIKDNEDTWDDFIKHSYNATKKGYIYLEIYIFFNRMETPGYEFQDTTGYTYRDAYIKAKSHDPKVNLKYIKKVNFEFYDHIDYMHCITHDEIVYYNLKNHHWPIHKKGVHVKNVEKYYEGW